MSKAPPMPTPANVSRILSIAGHSKRQSYGSRIRGMPNYSAGFKCEQQDDRVAVRYLVDGHYDPSPVSARRARVERYLPALQPHFDCKVIEVSDGVFQVEVRQRAAVTP